MIFRRTLVVTSCTGEKKFKVADQLLREDFQNPARLLERENSLSEYRLPALEMYTGDQHALLSAGVNALRSRFGNEAVHIAVLSAGYGVIDEKQIIAPYEVTFNDMTGREIVEWSRHIKVHDGLVAAIKDYDLVIFLLGDKYLKAVELPLPTQPDQQLLFFASPTTARKIPTLSNYHVFAVGPSDATDFSRGLVGLKGQLFRFLAMESVEQGRLLWNDIYEQPDIVAEILDKYRKKSGVAQPGLFIAEDMPDAKKKGAGKTKANKEKAIKKENDDAETEDGDDSANQRDPLLIHILSDERAKNYDIPMRYFIPEWDDRVDPGYNFLTDEATPERDPYLDDVYAHEMYPTPNYDGVLISKVKIEESKKKKQRITEVGVHDFIRFPKEKPIMGDCGAFGYINEPEPPYTTEEILDYYQNLGFNYGVSIDHLIVGPYAKDIGERQRRYDLTRNNAADFIDRWTRGNYDFIPIGVAQGWDPTSYRESVAALIDMGYKFIALGGMARTPTKQILEILRLTQPITPDYLELHLFGVARINAIPAFRHLGTTSFDSASHLRRAWLGSGSNYFTLEGPKYTALRVPPVDGHGVRVKQMIEQGKGSHDELKLLEQNALQSLRAFDKGTATLDEALEALLTYDELIGEKRAVHADMYRTVLEERPWQHCGCPICQEIGIDVIIFRGNNRNRRRGFHNTHVFYKQFKELFGEG